MRELLESLKIANAPLTGGVFLDTCYLFYMAEHQKLNHIDELAQRRQVLISSFNAEEVALKAHVVDEPVKERLRHWLKHNSTLALAPINIHPGQWIEEQAFVKRISPQILAHTHDASDAVLLAQALQGHCDVLTRDKHHLFTQMLEGIANHEGIKIEKDIQDL